MGEITCKHCGQINILEGLVTLPAWEPWTCCNCGKELYKMELIDYLNLVERIVEIVEDESFTPIAAYDEIWQLLEDKDLLDADDLPLSEVSD